MGWEPGHNFPQKNVIMSILGLLREIRLKNVLQLRTAFQPELGEGDNPCSSSHTSGATPSPGRRCTEPCNFKLLKLADLHPPPFRPQNAATRIGCPPPHRRIAGSRRALSPRPAAPAARQSLGASSQHARDTLKRAAMLHRSLRRALHTPASKQSSGRVATRLG